MLLLHFPTRDQTLRWQADSIPGKPIMGILEELHLPEETNQIVYVWHALCSLYHVQGFYLVCCCTCVVYVLEGVSASCLQGRVEDCRLEERVSCCTAVPKRLPSRTGVSQGSGLGAAPVSFLCRFLYRNSSDVVLEKSALSVASYREGKADTWDDLIMSQKALGCLLGRPRRIALCPALLRVSAPP